MVSLIYVFAITFNALLADTDMKEDYFRTILESMHTLLICGVFPDLNEIMRLLADDGSFTRDSQVVSLEIPGFPDFFS